MNKITSVLNYKNMVEGIESQFDRNHLAMFMNSLARVFEIVYFLKDLEQRRPIVTYEAHIP